jgi:hypothetical protein
VRNARQLDTVPPLRWAACAAVALLLACLGIGCPSTGTPPAEGSGSGEAPAAGGEEGSAAPSAASGPVAIDDAAAKTCRVNADCRVIQPGDWSARVECCYDYPCRLDYIAINQSTWDALREERRATPFDCAAYLQSEGPCAHRPAPCGLDQTPPEPACIEGQCAVAWPVAGPTLDPDAQHCASRADCVAMRASAVSWARRCCDAAPCGDDWVAVSRRTVAEVEAWAAEDLPDCAAWGHGHTCPEAVACDPVPVPDVTCRAGTCGRVEGAR